MASRSSKDWESIESDEEMDKATDLVTLIKSCSKNIESYRTSAVRPINEVVKKINGKHKKYTDDLDKAAKAMEGLMLVYHQAQRAIAEAEEKRIAEEREAERLVEAERLEKEASIKLVDAERLAAEGKTTEAEAMLKDSAETAESSAQALNDATDIPAPVVLVRQQARGNYGGVGSTRKRWTFRVEDMSKIPLEYLEINEVAVNAAIRAEVREIPGLEIYQKETMQVR